MRMGEIDVSAIRFRYTVNLNTSTEVPNEINAVNLLSNAINCNGDNVIEVPVMNDTILLSPLIFSDGNRDIVGFERSGKCVPIAVYVL